MRTLVLITLSILFLGCQDSRDEAVVEPSVPPAPHVGPPVLIDKERILLNSSFENDSTFSLDGWEDLGTAEALDSADTPPGGGSFSVTLSHGWEFGFIQQAVVLPPGTNRYRFSCWTKAPGLCLEPYCVNSGWISLGLTRGDTGLDETLFWVLVTDSVWTEYSFTTDLIGSAGNDTLKVSLVCPYSQDLFGLVFFDLVKVEMLIPG